MSNIQGKETYSIGPASLGVCYLKGNHFFLSLFFFWTAGGTQNYINHNPIFITGFHQFYIKSPVLFLCCSFVGLLVLII